MELAELVQRVAEAEGRAGVVRGGLQEVALEFDGTAYPADPTMAALLDPTRLPSATRLIDAELSPRIAAQ